jgi:hypothetical protein
VLKRERAKKEPSGRGRDRRMKKALAGPSKGTAKRQPERRGIVAARKQRWKSLAVRWTRRVDRRVDRLLVAAEPRVARLAHGARHRGRAIQRRATPLYRALAAIYGALTRALRWVGRRLRPLGTLFLRLLGAFERRVRRATAWAVRASTRASAVLTPERGACLVILASAACLIAAQFIDYRGVEVGRDSYAGLPGASAPTVGIETPLDAHSFLLIPVALLAAALAAVVMRNRRRIQLGRVVFVLGALCLAVVLAVDMRTGLDAGAQTSRFAGASAVLDEGFYAELASAAGLMVGGLLLVLAPKAAARYHARPCRTRTNLYARAASGLRRRLRRRASSRGRAARRPSPRRNGAASAPASRP